MRHLLLLPTELAALDELIDVIDGIISKFQVRRLVQSSILELLLAIHWVIFSHYFWNRAQLTLFIVIVLVNNDPVLVHFDVLSCSRGGPWFWHEIITCKSGRGVGYRSRNNILEVGMILNSRLVDGFGMACIKAGCLFDLLPRLFAVGAQNIPRQVVISLRALQRVPFWIIYPALVSGFHTFFVFKYHNFVSPCLWS